LKYVELKNNIGYIVFPTNIGILKNGKEIMVIDTGLDSRSSKLILKFLEDNDLNLKYILNTHSHSDHSGGNYYLQKETDCKIITPYLEDYFVENQFLKPIYVYSGATAPKQLKNRFMQSKDSKVFKTINKDEIFNFGEHEILAVDLNGHTYNHLGYIVNGVLFSGDAVISEDNLSKTKMSYYVDVEKLMDSINLLSKLEYELILPSHGKHSEKNKELLNYNREKIALINRLIIDITKEEINEEDLFSKVFTELDMNIRTTTEFFLMRSTLMAHISYLSDKNKIKIIVKNNRIYYKAVWFE